MILLRRAFKKHLFLLPVFTAMLMFSSNVWIPYALIVPLPKLGFIDFTECVTMLLVIVPISFLLYNNYETELALTCGVSTARLIFTKYTAILAYALFVTYAVIGLYQYTPYVKEPGDRIVFPIVIPDNYKIYMIISVTVTVLFLSSMVLLLRVLTRNCYVPVLIGATAHGTFNTFNRSIHYGDADARLAHVDLYISNYFLGNDGPRAMGADGMNNVWTLNRLLFLALSFIMLFATYMILRREHLHESFGE